jgi:esterase/lipase superfamily enzyme
MHVERHRWYSPALGQEMECELYGHAGRPVLAFPSQDGRMADFAGFGMIDACREILEAGRMRLVAVDGIDWQSWTNAAVAPAERARRHLAYDRYVMDELVPFVRKTAGRGTMWVTGCSMGAFHAANFFFRRPDVFDGVIGLSGLYSATSFIADQWDDATYFNSPLQYLPGLADPAFLDRYRRSAIAFGVGQGRWEEDCLADTRALEGILRGKGIPAWFDYWGGDVDHDWPWWRKMLPYFLDRMGV